MKRVLKKVMIISVITFIVLLFESCGKTSFADYQNSIKQKRSYSEDVFLNPPVDYRPLPIIHNNVDKGMLLNLKNLGYGGIVTNVSFTQYLQSEEMWKEFEENTRYLIEDLGQRMWIYDERHYPSGSAGGLVLKENPQWQAKGVVCLTSTPGNDGIISIEKPYGHENIVAAMAYKGTTIDDLDPSTKVDLSEYVSKEGNISWKSPGDGWIAVCLYSKNFYEGTHAVNNWAESKRYINLLEVEPVQKFIDLTYKKYYDRVGKYFGKGIEAFFTDEPSLMGTYFDAPPHTPLQLDKQDPKIELFPTVNYGDKLINEFENRRGYNPEDYLPFLFGGETENAQKFRWDYYKTLSELVAENYTGRIGEFCDKHNIALSGHLLLEEDIFMHPIFEGNYLQIYKNMQFPGIDLLTSHPEKSLQWACTTAKFASSAANYDRRKLVMSEVSDAFDSRKGSVEQRVASIAVQYALGVNHINSYYGPNQMSEDENKLFTDTIGRMGYMLDGGLPVSRVAIYYPIEGIWSATLPPAKLWEFNTNVQVISDCFKELSLELLQNQIDYEYLDNINMLGCQINNGQIITPGYSKYSVIVIPYTPALYSGSIDFLLKAAENGVKIVIQGFKSVITEEGVNKEEYLEKLSELINHKNTVFSKSVYDVVPTLEKLGVRDIKISGSERQVIYKKKQYENSSVYMLVNTSNSDKKLKVTLNEKGHSIRIWDVFTGEVRNYQPKDDSNGNTTGLNIELKVEKAIFITVED